jgi:hypothetical protein
MITDEMIAAFRLAAFNRQMHEDGCPEGEAIRAGLEAAMGATVAPDNAEWNAAIERAAKVARGQYVSTSEYHEDSPYYGSDTTPDRSDWGRGIDRGREMAAIAIRALKRGDGK